MKKENVTVGETYMAKVSGLVVPVRIDSTSRIGGWDATNLQTNHRVHIKSCRRLRGAVKKIFTLAEYNDRGKPFAKTTVEDTPPQSAPAAITTQEATQEATAPVERDPGERGANGAKRVSGLDAAAQVLAEAGKPLNAVAIAAQARAKGLWTTNGKTPANTLNSAISREIKVKGDASRFAKAERGKFKLANA